MSDASFEQHGEIHQGHEPHSRVLLTIRFTRWLALSLLLAWTGPFILIALLAALLSGLGVSMEDIRESVVSFASAEPAAWIVAKRAWTNYAVVLGACVLIWRVLSAAPVQRLQDVATRRIAASAAVVFEPTVERLERLPPPAQAAVALFLAVAAITGAIMFVNTHATTDGSRYPPPKAPMPKPVPSAALMLPGGAIRSGEALIEMHGDDTFVVQFKSDVEK